ncbi:hypothetical protein V8G54_031443 [Vigna mungo]|uniref:Uncharacterized protein n=1 Tax=Vigna mungo TaxID=3915 RepID=A0AAQ3MK40_VIGMU
MLHPRYRNHALQRHPHSKPSGLSSNQAILCPGIKHRLKQPQSTPSDKHSQHLHLHIPSLQGLPRIIRTLPRDNNRCLKEQNQHHPKPIKTLVNIPKRPLLHKTSLAYALLLRSSPEEITLKIQRPPQPLQTPPTPKILINVIIISPCRVRSLSISATINFNFNSITNWHNYRLQEP